MGEVVAIASDHAGFEFKGSIKDWLVGRGFEVDDKGVYSSDAVDYPQYARLVAKDVAEGRSKFGVLICGSGIGMCIAANRVRGARAVVLHNAEEARLSRMHNHANIACFGARLQLIDEVLDYLDVFVRTQPEGGRHARRVSEIDRES